MDPKFSQDEIDRLFSEFGDGTGSGKPAKTAVTYDFRRPDRIPKEQLRSIHLMHDFLARNLASSLGAYLRAYITVSLVSVEQISFEEFQQYLPTPTSIANVGMRPLDGNAVLELNPSLVFPMLNVLLGGSGESATTETRELTEIESSIIEGVVKIVLHDLKEAWAPVTDIDFSIEGTETQPQLMQILSPNEAVVAIGFEITMGDSRGMMNLGIPSIMVKMMGQKFEQQWSIQRRSGSSAEQNQMRLLLNRVPLGLEALVSGARIRVEDLLNLEQEDVISLDIPVTRPAELRVNGKSKFRGEIVATGTKRGMLVSDSFAALRTEN